MTKARNVLKFDVSQGGATGSGPGQPKLIPPLPSSLFPPLLSFRLKQAESRISTEMTPGKARHKRDVGC